MLFTRKEKDTMLFQIGVIISLIWAAKETESTAILDEALSFAEKLRMNMMGEDKYGEPNYYY